MEIYDAWQLRGKRFTTWRFSRDIMRELSELRPDNLTGALYIVKDYLVILACAYATIRISWWLYPLAVLIIGAQQRGLTTIAHDAAHRTLARSTGWNYVLGIVFAAYPVFQRHWAYRYSHVHLHHPYLGDPERDPDLKFFISSGVYDVRPPREYAFAIVWKAMFGGATVRYLRYLWSERFLISREGKKDIDRRGAAIDTYGFAIFWLIVIFGFALTQSLDLLVLFWLVPYLTTFQALGWFIELAEHSPMCETETEDVYLTRNRKGNLIERLLVGANLDEYHLEHHLSPGVPFWHLKRAQKIRSRDPRYAEVADSWGGLFASGPKGQPSVINQLLERNRRLYEAQRGRLAGEGVVNE
ncbi:fatty acid desaturase [Paraburkholderia atlantica]|uniref:Fatty acid desaturase n=2 Tax=Paraburkholderia TaxID=1822464 RepID=A0A7W8LEQ8_9BURK|nr:MULTISPECIES: fatty acid desaturase family protein [Paraburkholderia]MBB5404304.1 fatty acid desaturase [Paraburkholderia youngii]MBB5420391.1 fatty acid desaturase [Paraburkholderia atlantica]MBB5428838.1 fatty acid desaturase [Paraburkholderia atlantica]MPW09937.1 dihydrorhizobitoxine desaturase [Paraburkholderia atlantica]NUY34291.1 fatty acid desaturase family protein [Paraburkholderia atlantica]